MSARDFRQLSWNNIIEKCTDEMRSSNNLISDVLTPSQPMRLAYDSIRSQRQWSVAHGPLGNKRAVTSETDGDEKNLVWTLHVLDSQKTEMSSHLVIKHWLPESISLMSYTSVKKYELILTILILVSGSVASNSSSEFYAESTPPNGLLDNLFADGCMACR